MLGFNQKGFTLIEIMLVIAVIAMLAIMAVPTYQRYTIRTRIVEGVSLVEEVKAAVAEYYTANGSFPQNNTEAGLPDANQINSPNVEQIAVSQDGLVTITFKQQNIPQAIRGTTLQFIPTINANSIEWSCQGSGSLANKYRPAICRTTE